MTLSFAVAIKRFRPRTRRKIEILLLLWATGSRIGRVVATNLRDLEHFLSPRRTKNLLSLLLRNARLFQARDLSDIEQLYDERCNSHAGKGGVARLPAPGPLLGRAVSRKVFLESLRSWYPRRFPTPQAAVHFLERLLRLQLSSADGNLRTSRFLAWVTFSEDPAAPDPFAFLSYRDADEVRAFLGLDPKHSGPLLLMVYDSSNIKLLRPTIADAAISPFFQPPPVNFVDFGWTTPWPPGFLSGRLSVLTPAPRPEALHPPLAFSHINQIEQLS